MEKIKIGVLISGGGTNLQALIDACNAPDFPAEIALVVSNKEDAYGLKRAESAGIPTSYINHKDFKTRTEFDNEVHIALIEKNVECVCLAGFMRLVSSWFVEQWIDRLINVHPSLLPSFKGIHGQKDALDAGVRLAGCTIHFVRPAMDVGPIITQGVVPVLEADTTETLSARILKMEHICYPRALKWFAEGRLSIVNEKVVVADYQPDEGLTLFY
ncbi:MAG: phosphoribosylglycinamide formyltransferase [Alphaproteobacteria bacterium]